MKSSQAAPHLESDLWKQTYLAESERQRRLRAMPAKMARLGLEDVSRDAAILDLCCGSGETLITLYEMGFRNLSGVDLTVPDTIAADPRFIIKQGNALDTALPPNHYDWVLNIHAMHHFASADNVDHFLAECFRILKPGGRLGIIDFSNSFQIRLAFRFFRCNTGLVTPYLRYFGKLIQEEWSFLQHYLPQWPRVSRLLHEGRFQVVAESKTLFYFHLVLRKPIESGAAAGVK
jgi:ubiquinone/menaquinone biosynthesis C-methylase UbiE